MKKLYFALMALGLSLTANAADYYVIGEDVNGAKWSLKAADALMTETSAGVYEWSGTSLKSRFKINDGTWDNANANFGSNGSELTLGAPYSYAVGSSSGNIIINGQEELTNPKVVLDTNAGTITVTGEGSGIVVIGKAVYLAGEFNQYTADDASYKFTEEGEGVYTLSLATFTSDFKVIYDGAWLGYADAPIQSGVAVTLGDTGYQNCTLASNPANNVKFSFNANDKSLVVTYEGGDDPEPPTPSDAPDALYVVGNLSVGQWTPTAEGTVALTKDGDVFSGQINVTDAGEGFGYFSFITATGADWDVDVNSSDRYGAVAADAVIENEVPVEMKKYAVGVDASSAASWKVAPGVYNVTANFETMQVVLTAATDAVAEIEAAEGEAVYFNLQGVQVENPANGVYVKVLNGKATKVVVK